MTTLVDYLSDGNPWLNLVVASIVKHGPFDDRLLLPDDEALVALEQNYRQAYALLDEHFDDEKKFRSHIKKYRNILLQQHRKDTSGFRKGLALSAIGFKRDRVETVVNAVFHYASESYRLLDARVNSTYPTGDLSRFDTRQKHEEWLDGTQTAFHEMTKGLKYISDQYSLVWSIRFNGVNPRKSINSVLVQFGLPIDPEYDGLSDSISFLYSRLFESNLCLRSPAVIGCLEQRIMDKVYE